MSQPTVGIGGEVWIVTEDLIRTHILFELHEETLLAHVHVKGIEGFHPVEILRKEIGLTEWRHAEIDEGESEDVAA